MKITEPMVLMDGLTARSLSTGIVAVDLHYSADPELEGSEKLAELEQLMGGRQSWRWLKEMELDSDAQAGAAVFEHEWLERQRRRCINPLYCMDIGPAGELVKRSHGRLKVYIDPQSQPEDIPPDLDSVVRSFGLGTDVGAGTGATDSAIEVFCAENYEQAATFTSNNVTPAALGRLQAQIARYFNNALICAASKMHGLTAIRATLDDGYTFIWREVMPDRLTETPTQRLGWTKGEMRDKLLYGRWVNALDQDLVILHSIETIEQHRQYIYDELGRPVFQRLKNLPPTARLQHGDRVVAAALAYRACLDLPKYRRMQQRQMNMDSFAGRRADYEYQRAIDERDGW